MKKTIVSFVVLFFSAAIAMAQPPAGPVKVGDNYGAVITADKAIPTEDLPGLLKGDKPVQVKVMGTVTDVCSKKGCWMTLETPDKTKVFVKMKDYAFFVPVELIGRSVVLEGEAKMKVTSVEELKHYAQDAKKSKEEIAAIKEPEKEIRFMANGIKVTQ
jgi:hypothetical protein